MPTNIVGQQSYTSRRNIGKSRMAGSFRILGTTVALSSNSTVSSAKCVRVRNTDTVDALITHSDPGNNTISGTVQLTSNEIVYLEKKASEYLQSNNSTSKTLVTNVTRSGT